MTNILYVIIALIVFSVLVLVHEFGHYFVAKKNGILVKEFAIGMGPTVVSTKKGDTVYSIRLLPLGGFCSMLGEDEANNDPRSFNSKTPLQRIAVVVMGPVMNFVFAFFIVFFISATATGVIFPTVVNVLEGTNAAEKGLEVGDTIYSVNGERIGTYQDLFLALDGCNGETLDVVVTRDGKKIAMEIEPSISEQNRWIIGFTPLVKSGLFSEAIEGYDKVTLAETVKDTIYNMIYYVKSVVVGFIRIFTFNVSPEEIAGPIGIVQIMGESVEVGMQTSVKSAIRNLMNIAALLSTNLGAINLFPIPAMDGGRLVFLIIEAIRGKGIDRDMEGKIHFVGFVLLMVFMLFIAGNDISRLF